MRGSKKFWAILLTLTMIIAMIPVSVQSTKTQAAASFSITSPQNGKLVAAGNIDIMWSAATTNTVKDYVVYINGAKVATVNGTKYEYYTTTVRNNEVYVVAEFNNGTSETCATIKFGVNKKGLGLATDMGRNISLADMGVSWYYNWGENPSTGSQYQGIEYVPMVWQPGGNNANGFKNKINGFKNKGYKYALCYNEPDLNGQAVLSVDAAYNTWKGLNDVTGIRVSSPVTALWPKASSNWFQPFMQKIDQNGDRKPDFISIHCYPDNYAGAGMAKWFLEEVVDWTWQKYGLPIWITEFSTTGANVTATGGNGTKEFWENVMPGLDAREYVERYAAFDFNSKTTGLYTYDGVFTEAGEVYKSLGNPDGYDPGNLPEADYTTKVSGAAKNLLGDSVTINNVTCTDYISQGGVTATASSLSGNNTAANAIDGDINSRWESKQGSDNEYLVIDLGQTRKIKQVDIAWEGASASKYTIEVSNDGNNWTEVAVVESGDGARTDSTKLKTQAEGRYVRIKGVSRTTAYGYSIFDMAIYGTNDNKVDETTTKAPVTTKTPATTTTKQQATTGIKVSNIVSLNGAEFVGYVGGNTSPNGKVTADAKGDALADIVSAGVKKANAAMGIQAQYNGANVLAGQAYKYTATISTDNQPKIVTVIVKDSATGEVLSQETITVNQDNPVNYSTTFVAKGIGVDIVYAMGVQGTETAVRYVKVSIKNNKLVTTTAPVATTANNNNVQTTKAPTNGGNSVAAPANTSIKKIVKKASAKKAIVKIKKVEGAVGYNVQWSTSKKFKKAKSKFTKKVKYTIKKLKKGKTYWVRVKAYNLVGTTKQFSAKWSKKKKIKL